MNNPFNNPIDTGVSAINRFMNFIKILVGGSSEVPLADVLVISRILFAIVMIGFIGHHFERTKQSIKRSVINKD